MLKIRKIIRRAVRMPISLNRAKMILIIFVFILGGLIFKPGYFPY